MQLQGGFDVVSKWFQCSCKIVRTPEGVSTSSNSSIPSEPSELTEPFERFPSHNSKMLDFILGTGLGYYGSRRFPESINAAQSASGQNVAANQMQHLIREHNELRLVCAALWSMLKQKSGCTDEELVAAIEEADMRDGVKDGQMTSQKTACPKCGRTLLTKRRDKCSWCGAETGLPPV